ncbi:glycoside hydrolase family 43 protein [Flavilitoribacter nigricans]|uniref:Glycosyl hydrolase n=1 Tax=Flavilitoribacter nigricans (strain ATCC 23147 / DSM 23189 / NBRC 102662 / NCIMB 1420 / SS-2) TaxID=1122177 RepID=A0A2D0N8V1_FLAN2|nr:glycoside hydrolase family 43 protein [Flavilitoribacter nigricans]PHN04579.1 glycosyl hydrolase [Flavilitoribacter nigricans DSM 23189 = NBRC 102662]
MARSGFYVLLILLTFACSEPEPEVYLFSFFQGNGEDGLHLASSEDGLHWTALNDNKSYLTPTAGEDKLMRDPCIIRGGDGKFHMVWTVSWNEQGIGYANSEDLINWSEQRYLPVMAHESGARNCWAPELFYDDQEDRYLIYWATTIPGRFPETDTTGDNGYNHRMYYTTTKDFETFSPTELLYDDGFNVIDATIQEVGGKYIMFLKNEIKHPEAEKNIRIATSESLLGPYTSASEPITDNWVEGPTAIETDQGWVVYFDRYTNHQMGAVRSSDLENWTDISGEVQFPEGTRHGTVFKVKKSVLEKL